MFIVDPNPTFTHNVKVTVPVDGGTEVQTCKAKFNVLPVEEADMFDLTTSEGSTAFLMRAVDSMDDLEGKDGDNLPWNDSVRDQLFRLRYVRIALTQTYFTAISGARSGN